MQTEIPRIKSVKAIEPGTIQVKWAGSGGSVAIDLTGWIATGGELLAKLKDPEVFKAASVVDYGAAVEWGEDSDLAIDSYHLTLLAKEQQDWAPADLMEWQKRVRLSNQEAADLLGVRLSTWNNYRAGSSPISAAVQIVCRAIERDPVIMQAHYRPRKAGRPAAARAG